MDKACLKNMHNSVFKSLKEVVHFYNTRDDGSWPAPEVSANVNKVEVGNLGLRAFKLHISYFLS